MIILTILLVLLGIPAFYGIRQLIKERQRKKKQITLATAYERLLLQNKLIPWRYEIMSDSVIALDRKNKKLVVVDSRKATMRQYCIPLRTIGETRIVKERNTNGDIQKIELQLMQKRGGMVYSICFFDAAHDRVTELPHLAKQAIVWHTHVNLHKRPGIMPIEQEYVL
jgi:hypothetical protein